jgi:hypothetical protein
MLEQIAADPVKVNYGKLLERQLEKWKGGGHHPRGIAEYISNSDDSYRRLEKYCNQDIITEIYSRSGKKIEKLIIKDFAEGMSFADLENKFFQYFESFSGREKGEKVTGRFGTGGKAYAIMNFRHCWIISVKNGKECKAWFQWNPEKQIIIRGYDGRGYKDKPTTEPDGTTVILESSIKVSIPLENFVSHLEKLGRIRHVLKNQNVVLNIIRKNHVERITLKYHEPNPDDAKKIWHFPLPENLKNEGGENNNLILRYFEKPIGENAFIDISDGISSVADLKVSELDGRPFSKYINGELIITQLLDSVAVKENRRGLEEGDDLTEDIKNFISEKVKLAISEIEEAQRDADRERRIHAANEKLNELSKFLSKQDLKFKTELKELRKRFSIYDDIYSPEEESEVEPDNINPVIFRRPTAEDLEENLIKGNWVDKSGDGGDQQNFPPGIPEFVPNPQGKDFAVKVTAKKRNPSTQIKKKQGLQVLYSNDPNNPESPIMNEYMEPVSDKDMVTKGIIWINAVHPLVEKFENEKGDGVVRDENIANFVLMMVGQYYAQKEAELQPEDERDDLLLLFRKHFFRLQIELRMDREISYFEKTK